MRWLLPTTFLFVVSAFADSVAEKECKCILNNIYLDVFILIDDSMKMGVSGPFEVASDINSIFGYSQIRVGSHYSDGRGARVAVITYNQTPTIQANLSTIQSTDSLTKLVYSLQESASSVSNLQGGLQLVKEMMEYTDGNARRNNTKTVLLIYASDYYDNGQPTISQLGDELKAQGITIITVSDVSRNDNHQITNLAALASPKDGFTINDDYSSEEVQQAMCRANCFCPPNFEQFIVSNNTTYHKHGSCIRTSNEQLGWTNAKFSCQNLHKQGYLATEFSAEKHSFNTGLISSSNYHTGLHFVNNGYFWEQPVGTQLVQLSNSLYPLPTKPSSGVQCVDSNSTSWLNVNCYNDMAPFLCEVAACDTENFCA